MKRIIRLLTFAAFATTFFACSGTQTQSAIPEDLKGTWSGIIDGLGLSIVMHLQDSCTLDSPDQGAYGLKANASMKGDNTLRVKFLDMPGSFTGSIQGDSLVGTFSQMTLKKRLALGRGEIVRNRPQTPEPPFPYDTDEVSFEHDGIVLGGTLATPHNCNPGETSAVVLVSGSGQQNRDEELMAHRPFAVIADALARNGIASLRYDDRGCGSSGGTFEEATTFDFADDARAAVHCLRERGFGKVGVIGHSEGGTIAFMLGADEDVAPDFIVSLAGMVDRGDSTLFRQVSRQIELQGAPKKLSGFAARVALRKMLKQKSVWMDCFIALDPAPFVAEVKCPFLALNGDKDTQVIPEFNLSKIESLCPAADCRLYPGLNHLFQHCTTGLTDEYARIEETISPEVLADIAEWISGRKAQ
ncbi:MAG: alpha/beta fold hydrolase [Bacteroidales bacterium]|nr:alpha/beta fold hydrolase [Bacteroidales bacterium]